MKHATEYRSCFVQKYVNLCPILGFYSVCFRPRYQVVACHVAKKADELTVMAGEFVRLKTRPMEKWHSRFEWLEVEKEVKKEVEKEVKGDEGESTPITR